MEETMIENIISKYLDGDASEDESITLIDYMMDSKEHRIVLEMAAVCYTQMMPASHNL